MNQKNVFQRLKPVKKLIKVALPLVTNEEIIKAVDHCVRYKDGVRKTLTEQEMAIQDIILKHGYKLRTIRYWFQAYNLPQYLQEQIKSGEIEYSQAKKIYGNYRIKTDKEKKQEIINDIQDYFSNIKEYIGDEQ